MRMPRLLKVCRNLRLLYALSAASRLGRRLGQPRPGRLIPPRSSRVSTTVASCCWPGVRTKVMSWPLPSTRTWILVLNPPWLRPKASRLASLFSSQQHAGGIAQSSHPRSELPNRSGLLHRPVPSGPPISGPIVQPCAIGETGYGHSTSSHSVPADLARVHPFALSTASRLSLSGGHYSAALSAAFLPAAMAPTVPIVHRLVHVVGSYQPVYRLISTLHTRPSLSCTGLLWQPIH